MLTSSTEVPLSSLDFVPVTEATAEALQRAGMSAADLSEAAAQALLAVRADLDGEVTPPRCYQQVYDPASSICGGCLFAARCWRADHGYLRRVASAQVAPPPGVPAAVVAARVEAAQDRPKPPPPPARATGRPLPPPPPKR